ncbi:response regulator [Devosia rhizoryzae]|uniref:Response regulator n=1 Tax=Devosia rhizoryzae TaxID=2774137 RepID=A0ABX7C5D4_9HYPH|nr:response regulator [Devosia rhizoryzae]QQR39421.1 response regulator [Devosia rhizoryzae]
MTSPITVLIVEDEPLLRMNISDRLDDLGFIVLEAANADEAIAMLAKHSDVQVMFTDIDMPGSMDGLKLAAAVRNRWPPIRIIVTSGHHRVGEDDMPSGSRFFGKPYHPEAIASAMREMLAV